MRYLKSEIVDEICEQYRNGYDARSIAEWHGIFIVTVYHKLKQRGVPVRHPTKGIAPEKRKPTHEYRIRYDGTEEDLYRKLTQAAAALYRRSLLYGRKD